MAPYWSSIGAMSIMMMSNTSMTSTSGVTLMSALSEPFAPPTSIAIGNSPSAWTPRKEKRATEPDRAREGRLGRQIDRHHVEAIVQPGVEDARLHHGKQGLRRGAHDPRTAVTCTQPQVQCVLLLTCQCLHAVDDEGSDRRDRLQPKRLTARPDDDGGDEARPQRLDMFSHLVLGADHQQIHPGETR